MGCSSCGSTSNQQQAQPFRAPQPIQNVDCPYTIEQVNSWLSIVNCVRNTGVYTQIPNVMLKQINIYVGVLLSAQNYASNLCYFKNELAEVESFTTVLTIMNLCQS